jgi:hypothetical protein
MKVNRLKHLYVEELKDLYSAENQLVKALPKMAKAATSEELRAAFEGHLDQTKEHVVRLEKIFKALGESPNGKKCRGMEALIKEGGELIEEDLAPGNWTLALSPPLSGWNTMKSPAMAVSVLTQSSSEKTRQNRFCGRSLRTKNGQTRS